MTSSIGLRVADTFNYLDDFGAIVENVKGVMSRPGDFDDALVTAILGVTGVDMVIGDQVVDSAICPEPSNQFSPRRIKFIRTSGNEFSLPYITPARVLDIYVEIRDLVNAAIADDPVLCGASIGETWRDIVPRFRTNTAAPAAGTSPRAAPGAKQPFYAGKINYAYDGGGGATEFISVRTATDVYDEATGVAGIPTVIGAAAWNGCGNAIQPSNPCLPRANIKYRRLIPTFFFNKAATTQGPDDVAATYYGENTIPLNQEAVADRATCATTVANLASTACLAYRGESNPRLDLFVPAP